MDQFVFDTSDAPEIIIENVAGSLRLSGWEQPQLQVEGDPQTTRVEPRGSGFVITSASDCALRVPRQAQIKIGNVAGDVRVKALQGSLEAGDVSGDFALRQSGSLTLRRVAGDVSVKKVFGDFSVKEISGDFSARGVAGTCKAERVSGDVYVRDITGGVYTHASGDTILSLSFKPDQTYEVKTQGDLLCRLPANTSATIHVECNGDVSVDYIGARVEGKGRQRVITVGEGLARVQLQAGDDISITTLSGDPDSMGELGERFGDEFGVMAEELSAQIETQIETHLADLEKHLSGLGTLKGERASAKVREAVERARQKAEATRQRTEARIHAAQRRAERHERHEAGRHKGFGFVFDLGKGGVPPRPPVPPTPPHEPVGDEERMMILKMVEQKKISIEEAEKLLAALEGKAK